MLTLYCLGDLRLDRDGATLLAGRRKPLALLAFLARRRQRRSSREELAALLWGASDDASARKSLRQCLSDLRSVDGMDFTESDAGIAMAADTIVTDATLFETDIRTGRWQSADERWRGDFIPGGESLGDEAWRSWLEGERAALRRQFALVSEQITASAEQRGEWREVVRAAQRWRTALPDDGRAWVREIHALQASGRLTDAIARAAEAEHYFRSELRVGVPDDLSRLSRVLGRLGQVAGTAAASLLTPDLVGRAETLAVLARSRLRLRTVGEIKGSALLVATAEGRGKTRLLRTFARQVRETDPGATVIEAAALTSERTRDYSLLQNVLNGIVSHDALAGCSPETLATLAHIAPSLREHLRHVPTIGPPTSDAIAASFSRALAEVAHEAPVIVVIDDLPEGDPESLAVLIPLMAAPPTRTLVVASGRPESWHRSVLAAELLNRADPATRLSIDSLNRAQTREMLASMAPLAPATLDALTDSLHDLSGGIPGLLTSLITHQATTGVLARGATGEWSSDTAVTDPVSIPSDIEDRWRDRHQKMSPEVQHLVGVLAVLAIGEDRTVDATDLEHIAQLDPVPFRGALDLLVMSGVFERTGDAVRFSADLHRLLALRGLAPSARLLLHARAAKRLRSSPQSPANRARIGHHRRASRASRKRPLIGLGVAGAVMAALVTWYAARRNAATVSTGTPVLLADVENLTGDSAFDRTLYLAASVGLQQSRQFSLFPRSRVRETLALMQRPGADSMLDERLAREVALRENLRRVVVLGVARVESAYVLTARIIQPSSGRDLFVDQERAESRGDVLDGLDRLLTRVRRASGESRDSVRAYALALPRVTTSSLPALQMYAIGTEAWSTRRYEEAIAAYRRAVALDSTFALAWLALAEASYQLGRDRTAANAALAQAMRHADRLTERERLRLEQTSLGYQGRVDGQLQVAERLARRFPERDTWYSLGTFLMRMRRCPDAIAALERSLTFDSTFAAAHINVATCHQFLGASDSAVAAYTRAYAVDSASVYAGALNHEFGVALVRAGLVDSARRVYTKMAGGLRAQDRQFGQRSLAYLDAWVGKSRGADAHFDSAAVLAAEIGTTLSEFRNRVLQADHRLTTAPPRAFEALDAATQLMPRLTLDPAFAMYAGLAHIRAGQLQRASKLLDDIGAASRAASSSDRTIHAVLSARLALARGNETRARVAIESATDTTWSDYVLATLVDVHVARGHADSAFEASTQLAKRATFGTNAQDTWMRNLIRMAQLAEQLGHRGTARTAYARLEAHLSHGDPDHPLRIEARRAAARLAGQDAGRVLRVPPPPSR